MRIVRAPAIAVDRAGLMRGSEVCDVITPSDGTGTRNCATNFALADRRYR
jgi:hypothetical protein